jgi:hypothetical protein
MSNCLGESAHNWRKSALNLCADSKFSPIGKVIGASADGRLTVFGALSAQLGASAGLLFRSKRENWACLPSLFRGHH